MLDQSTIERINELRGRGLSWSQIAERTGVPRATAYYAVMGRQQQPYKPRVTFTVKVYRGCMLVAEEKFDAADYEPKTVAQEIAEHAGGIIRESVECNL